MVHTRARVKGSVSMKRHAAFESDGQAEARTQAADRIPASRAVSAATLTLTPLTLRGRAGRSFRFAVRVSRSRAPTGYGPNREAGSSGPRLAIGIDRGRKISTTTGKGRRPGSAEADRNRGPVGQSGPTSAALSVGESERAVGRAEDIEAARVGSEACPTHTTKPGPPCG
jgi:hypothetical protein